MEQCFLTSLSLLSTENGNSFDLGVLLARPRALSLPQIAANMEPDATPS